ncbi:hypothetical protein N7532_005248 [Penicillium argentinense]|uniref:Ubiquitin-like protease family profile domain-containing protein n=1 Tax=Penicillium argentinense TaxID=1131581 RepID=A0A9W9FDM5_9EURO|nr:uncharacterized protein N7532_005248 [Penicillium argentinense]KAJ5098247.1 hypothetical protein N7532_005248 [Penicillium argentinense]
MESQRLKVAPGSQNADRFMSIPGAFPPTPPQSPPQSPRVASKDVPTAELEEVELVAQTLPILHTELGSHLHPKPTLTLTPSPKRAVAPSTAPAKAIRKPALQYDMEILDPWMRRSIADERVPLSAVSLFSRDYKEQRAIPPGRIESPWASELAAREKAKRERERAQLRPTRIFPKGPAVRKLSSAWSEEVVAAMRRSPDRAVARIPAGDDLYPKDILTCLREMSWLNDEIINSYLTILVQYLRQSTGNTGNEKPRYHAFNTFFYSNLRDKGYQSVRRWANRAKIGGESLLDVDTVFIPVHQSSHWTLLVVRPADRTIEYFDSLGARGAQQVKIIKQWLCGELGAKYDEGEWNILQAVSSQQDNGSDCGVFLLTNAKAIALGIEPTAFGPTDTRLLRKKIVAELINGGLHGDFSPVDQLGNIFL